MRSHPPSWTWFTDYPPSELESDAPILATAKDAGQSLGLAVESLGIDTTFDGALLTRLAGIPSAAFGPGDLGRAHAPNEWVGVDELVLCARLYARILMSWCELMS